MIVRKIVSDTHVMIDANGGRVLVSISGNGAQMVSGQIVAIPHMVSALENLIAEMEALAARKSTRYAALFYGLEDARRALDKSRTPL